MLAAYRAFRYGEQYEHRAKGSGLPKILTRPEDMLGKIKELEKWVDQLN
jgi:hypothetical protein